MLAEHIKQIKRLDSLSFRKMKGKNKVQTGVAQVQVFFSGLLWQTLLIETNWGEAMLNL